MALPEDWTVTFTESDNETNAILEDPALLRTIRVSPKDPPGVQLVPSGFKRE